MNINDPNPQKGAAPPASAKDANARDQMQAIGRAVEELIPEGWGFIVLTYPHNDNGGRINYASNSKREDVLALMREFIAKAEADPRPGHV